MFSFLIGKLLKSKAEPVKVEAVFKPLITLDQYLTSNGRYPERMSSPECTPAVKSAAMELLARVNRLLNDLDITKIDISSGFRTAASNAKQPGAAKKSNHMSGSAIDLVDDRSQSLCKKINK